MNNYRRFDRQDTTMLLIDHQEGVLEHLVKSPDRDTVKLNFLKLAKAADALGMPLLLSTNQEASFGRLAPELESVLPDAYHARIERNGTFDALDDPALAAAMQSNRRPNLVLAGVGTDVCAVFSALHALDAGYTVQVIADACGTSSDLSQDVSLRRLAAAGATISTTASVLAELAENFSTESGSEVLRIMLARDAGQLQTAEVA